MVRALAILITAFSLTGLTTPTSAEVTSTGAPSAPPPMSELVKPTLVADRVAVAPGETFTVGIHYKLAPKWHVYWINPGDAGMATDIKWKLPKGWKASALQWPLPIRFEQLGIVSYGYADELLLTARLTVPATAKPGTTITLKADSTWLACKELCIPGEAKLTLDVPIATSSKPANQKLFASLAAQLPTELTRLNEPRIQRTSGSLPASTSPAWMGVALTWTNPPKQVEFFPAPPSDVQVSNIAARTNGNITRVQFQAKRLNTTSKLDALSGLLVYTPATGPKRGVWLRLPVGPGEMKAAKLR